MSVIVGIMENNNIDEGNKKAPGSEFNDNVHGVLSEGFTKVVLSKDPK